jgi:hypothetical protein
MTRETFPITPVGKDADPMTRASGASSRPRRGEASEFRLIFMVSFAIFLLVAMVERVLPSSWRSQVGAPDGGKSVIGEARAAARTFVPLAFMG